MRTQLYLTPADRGRPLSYEELLAARGEEGYRYELIEGRLEVSPIPGLPHEDLRAWLEQALRRYAERRPEVINHIMAPARVFLPVTDEGITAPEPDVAAYRDYPVGIPFGERDWRNVSPIVVVEVLSADTADKDLERNRRLYLRVPSIREYWILDTRKSYDAPALLAFRRRGARWARVTVPAGGRYATPLLPGFALTLDPHAG